MRKRCSPLRRWTATATELDLRNSGDGRIKLQAHWDAKVVRQPVQIETELISNGSDGLAYGDTLEMTAVVNVQPTDAEVVDPLAVQPGRRTL